MPVRHMAGRGKISRSENYQISLANFGDRRYNDVMTSSITPPDPGKSNPYDYFGRRSLGDPIVAGDILRNYADPVLAEYVDLDHLEPVPTHVFGPSHPISGPKEVILDVPYLSRFRDGVGDAEVLIVHELKSAPSEYVALQVAAQGLLILYKQWTDAGRPSSKKNFKVPILIMVLVYSGEKALPEGLQTFQDIYDFIPEELRPYVPQFRMIVVNFQPLGYENLPGNPDTQMVVEAMKRSGDGTLSDHFEGVVDRVAGLPVDGRLMERLHDVGWLAGRVANVPPERINKAITNIIKGKEGIEMTEIIYTGVWKGAYQEGEVKGKVDSILTLLQTNFKEVPEEIVAELNRRTDPTALQSLVVLAAQCKSLDEFAEGLK